MRAYLIGAFATLVLAGSAAAGASECSRTLDGGWRCKEPDGHVTERRPDGEGGARTTSTDPRKWGTTDGHGRDHAARQHDPQLADPAARGLGPGHRSVGAAQDAGSVAGRMARPEPPRFLT